MLCSMKELLAEAEQNHCAVGAFSVYSMEMVKGVIAAAEAEHTPIILQIAESRFPYAPLELMAPMMVNAARESKVRVAVHLDHGLHLDTIKRALDYGFTSVMLDASKLPFEENVRMTKKAVELAAGKGASVEAELGCVGGNEGMGDVRDYYTKPDEAVEFARETGIDALAVAIGNAHGNYKQEPNLQFDILKQIHAKTDVPLVLHGGSGISFTDFRRAIECGMRKINIATANLEALSSGAIKELEADGRSSYFSISSRMVEKVCECTWEHIYVFENKGGLNRAEEDKRC